MSDVWEAAWDPINEVFNRVGDDLQRRNEGLWWRGEHRSNPTFPFWACASFSRDGVAGEEDLVISLDFKRDEQMLEFSSDIALGDGQILADGPASTIDVTVDTAALRHWIATCVSQATTFIEEQMELLRSELT